METTKKKKQNSNQIKLPDYGVKMIIDKAAIMKLTGFAKDAARDIYIALVAYCNKGPDYIPCNSDFAGFMKWQLSEVLTMRYSTRLELVVIAFEDLKKVWIKEIKKQWLSASKPVIIKYGSDISDVILLDVPGEKEAELLNNLVINSQGKLENTVEAETKEKVREVLQNLLKQLE